METNLSNQPTSELGKMQKVTMWMSSTYHQYIRVWRLLRKPTMQEFKTIAKVSAIGLLLIGAIGFIIASFMSVIL